MDLTDWNIVKFDCLWLRYILLNNPETVKCYPKNVFFMSSWDAKPCKFTGFAGSRADAAGCSSYLTPVLGTPVPNFHRSLSWKSTKLTLHDYIVIIPILSWFQNPPNYNSLSWESTRLRYRHEPQVCFQVTFANHDATCQWMHRQKIPSRSSIFFFCPTKFLCTFSPWSTTSLEWEPTRMFSWTLVNLLRLFFWVIPQLFRV